MITKSSLIKDLENLGIDSNGTLLVHSSMKSIGNVDGGADTVLNALSEYMNNGLLVFPTHTWSYINHDGAVFDVRQSPSCVGILSELFRKRPGVHRSLHPTHSVAALGRDAEDFVSGDERFQTPCARGSAWGRLIDRHAAILLIGVDQSRNTFIHGAEEWAGIPDRLSDRPMELYTLNREGTRIRVPVYGHTTPAWDHYPKVDDILKARGIMHMGRFGQAETRLCAAPKTAELIGDLLRQSPELFSNDKPLT
ncbi:AAC(3) family N-acetyltransferase [Paenibacillus chungangensis]|uniref:Aminoglycoside N(3)-acetyltransferase n=1 Tax=Paenibacillus chungangensis TaxID=696535 RepID=A0ABW3HSR1_9BACL